MQFLNAADTVSRAGTRTSRQTAPNPDGEWRASAFGENILLAHLGSAFDGTGRGRILPSCRLTDTPAKARAWLARMGMIGDRGGEILEEI